MRKSSNSFYLSVEGQTEKLYFNHLKDLINSSQDFQNTIKLQCKIEKNPISFVKSITLIDTTDVYHVFDFEGNSSEDIASFERVLNIMKAASKMGKSIRYQLAYSNLTFELWILLHKVSVEESIQNKGYYLKKINDAYGSSFTSLNEMSESANIQRIINQITIQEVYDAIDRAETIKRKCERNNKPVSIYGYEYYRENPYLTVDVLVKEMLKVSR